ncbi:MAG: DegT/DnrJ/EryC1/StrS family aminotransferase [Sphingomicrobium sp.]
MKFLDLQAQYQSIKQEVDEAVLAVLGTSAYVLGPEVEAFERNFAAAHNASHGVAVNTGTSALHVALLAAGIGAGDEVITVPMTFTATVAAISYTGAKPVFVDIVPDTFTMDPAHIETKITPRTRAIMPVHLYGQAADMDPIMEIADRHGLTVIEDAAQAHLARYRDRPVGSIGHMAGFSFYPGKNLGAYGEGGLTTTNDSELAQKMRLLRDWGQSKKYEHDFLAYNYRMDGIQGAVLRVKLQYLDAWTERRRSRARLYQSLLANSPIGVAQELPDRRHVYHIFSVFHPERERLQAYLSDNGIQTGIHYPNPVHLQKAYAALGHGEGDFPISESIAREQLSLPMYAELSDEDVARVAEAVRAFA